VEIIPAPSPVLKRLGLLVEDTANTPKPVTGLGECPLLILQYIVSMIPITTEYVRARVANVHNVKQTRHDQGVNQEFRVGDLAVQDRYE
jgi:hypothetical protein